LYYNGAVVDTASTSEREVTLPSATTIYLGQAGGYAAWPLIPLTWRIDRRVWTAAEVAELDMSLRDPVANQVSVQARGRKYRIVAIPSTARNQTNGTAWIGNVVLEEHEYDSNYADVTSAEDW
jgi:hypothetical protein